MDYSEIMNITSSINIDEKEFENIDVELSEIEVKRTKKTLMKKVNVSRLNYKNRRFIKIVAASISFVVLLGTGLFLTNPALAEKIDLLKGIYERLGYNNEYNDYTEFIGKTKEVNGYKFTIDKLVVTPNRFTMAIKVNSEKPFDRSRGKESSIVENMITNIIMPGSIKGAGTGFGCNHIEYIDDKNALVVSEGKVSGGTYKKKGDINICINMGLNEKDYVYVRFNLKVDFSKSFDKNICTKINKDVEIGQGKTRIKEMNTSVIGTSIDFSDFESVKYGRFDIKVDEKIYSYSEWGGDGENDSTFIKELTYDVMSKAKSIEIIPIYKEDTYREGAPGDSIKIEISESMKLPAKFSGLKGLEGQIYKIEKVNNKLRVYYDCGDNTLGELSNTWIICEGTPADGVMEKDPNSKSGYIIEKQVQDDNKCYLIRNSDISMYKAGKPIIIK